MIEDFVLLEKSMYFFEISVSEITFTEKIYTTYMTIGKSQHFICKKDGITIVMDIQIVNCEIIEST